MSVNAVLHNRNAEHLRGRCTVNILTICKSVHLPLFIRKPGNDTSLNCWKVSHDKLHSRSWNKCSTDQLGECIRHIVINHLNVIERTCLDKLSCFRQVFQMILRKILQLNIASCPATCSWCAIKAEHSSCTMIPAGCLLHCRVFLDRWFWQL